LVGYPKSGDVIVVCDPPYSIAISPDRTQWFKININLDYADFSTRIEMDDIVEERLEKDFDQVSIESLSICTN